MAGIDRTKPEDIKPIDAAAYLCWGSGRGDLYDAIHAMKKDNERLREALRKIVEVTDYGTKTSTTMSQFAINNANILARSALQKKESE